MPRPRRRRRPNWGPILWLLLAAHVAAGVVWSPLTQVRKVRIEGSAEWDRGRLVSLLQTLKGRSSASLNPREVESLAQRASGIERAEFRRSLFGSASLSLTYYKPVAFLRGSRQTFLSADGALFQAPDKPDGFPIVQLHSSALKPAMTLAQGLPTARIAELIARVPASLKEKLVVEVDSEGSVCLNTAEATRITIGAADRIDEKLRTLDGLLADRPDLFRQVKEINLVEPSHPVWKAREGAKL